MRWNNVESILTSVRILSIKSLYRVEIIGLLVLTTAMATTTIAMEAITTEDTVLGIILLNPLGFVVAIAVVVGFMFITKQFDFLILLLLPSLCLLFVDALYVIIL
jgi:hypothetical protein